MNLYLAALLVYAAFLMGLGLWVGRRVRTSADFLVAGRRLGPGALFATFLAANIGAGSTVGATGLGYRFGLSAWWWVGSAGIGTLLLAQFIGPRIWTIAQRHRLSTLGDYLELRYSRAVKAVVALLFWFGALAILAGQLIAISWILTVVIDLPKWAGCSIGGAVAILYCTAGGLTGSAFINRFELAVTLSGLVLAVPFSLHALGGWSHLHLLIAQQSLAAAPARFSLIGAGPHQILAWIAILVPSFIVSPGLIQKLYGARSAAAVRTGISLNSIGQLLFAFVPPILGLCALAAFPHLANPELALPSAMKLLLPRWLGLWTLASIFSAELSATDAILFMLSSSLTVDLYQTFLNPKAEGPRLLAVGRVVCVLAGIAGIFLAIALPSIIAAVSLFYGLIAVVLFVPVLAGLYAKRALASAALTSIAVALATTLTINSLTHGHGLTLLSPQALGILSAALVFVAFSIFTRSRADVTPPRPPQSAGASTQNQA
jgi:SSS family solute:Na+ symporter